MKHIGNLEVTKDSKFEHITEVTGDVHVYGSAKLDAPNLQTVGGYVRVYGSAKLDALQTVGGYVRVDGDAKLDALQTVGGDVYVYGDAKLDALQTVGGFVRVDGDAKLDAPNLQTVGGDVYVYGGAKLDALQKKKDKNAKIICKAALELSFSLKGMIRIDGILSWLIGRKTIGEITAFEVKIVGKLNTSFAVQRGDVFSHGETIEKAIEDLRYKIGNRDASEFEKWRGNLDAEITIDEAIAAYRVITGACEYGVKDFVKSIKMPDKLTPNVVLVITKGKFGNDTFRKFLVV